MSKGIIWLLYYGKRLRSRRTRIFNKENKNFMKN